MRYNLIRKMDISNGPGIRVSVFIQGCDHHCKGCFNPETWDYNGGEEWTEETNEEILKLLDNPNKVGLSILGGDPFCAYLKEGENDGKGQSLLRNLLANVKKRYPEKDIWLWTGYVLDDVIPLIGDCENYEDNRNMDKCKRCLELFLLLKHIDVIVDGPYIEEEKDVSLKYAGSRNQRVIDVQKSLEHNSIVLYEK